MDEMTKNAIEAAKKTNRKGTKRVKSVNDNPEIDGGIVEIIELPDIELSANKIKLGENKIVTIKPWTGKTKKKIRKIFEYVENPEDVDFIAIMKTLIYDYVSEDVYLNEGEQQYLLSKIRDISISDKIHADVECPNCAQLNTISTSSSEFIHYKENELPFKYKNDISFIDIESLKLFEDNCKEILESDEYDGITTETDIETAMHLIIKTYTTKEIIDYLDELPLKDTSELMENLRTKLPRCNMYFEKTCKKCKTNQKFPIDITEDIFESLLK